MAPDLVVVLAITLLMGFALGMECAVSFRIGGISATCSGRWRVECHTSL